MDLEEYRLEVRGTVGTKRVRALVKALAPAHSGVTGSSVRGILADIQRLNKMEIYNQDIRAANFRGGKLVDFGSSLTEPSCWMEAYAAMRPEELVATWLRDLKNLDNMVEDEGIPIRWKATPETFTVMKLRSWRKMQQLGEQQHSRNPPDRCN